MLMRWIDGVRSFCMGWGFLPMQAVTMCLDLTMTFWPWCLPLCLRCSYCSPSLKRYVYNLISKFRELSTFSANPRSPKLSHIFNLRFNNWTHLNYIFRNMIDWICCFIIHELSPGMHCNQLFLRQCAPFLLIVILGSLRRRARQSRPRLRRQDRK